MNATSLILKTSALLFFKRHRIKLRNEMKVGFSLFNLGFGFLLFLKVDSATLGVISQNGISSTCAQTYFHIDTDACTCTSVNCPASSKGSDPQINEFGTNSISTKLNNGAYVFVDEYWNYIQQINPDGTQVPSINHMVQQECMASGKSIYEIVGLSYHYSTNLMYGFVMVPNNTKQTYDGKIVTLDINTGECDDVLTGFTGSGNQLPNNCCGSSNVPAMDQNTTTMYTFGASGYSEQPKLGTVIAFDIPNKKYSMGFISSYIYTTHGYMFYDSQLAGLYTLGYDNRVFGIYQLQTPWADRAVIPDKLIVSIGKVWPSAFAYNETDHKLYLLFENDSAQLTTVNMAAATATTCSMPKTCSNNIWTFPILL